MATKPKALPKTPGAVADTLYTARANRLKLEALIKEMKAEETRLKEHLFTLLPKLEATAITGKLAVASISRHVVPTIDKEGGWEAFCKHLKRTGEFDLIDRGVNVKAWRERNDAGKKVPGTTAFILYKVNSTKKGAK